MDEQSDQPSDPATTPAPDAPTEPVPEAAAPPPPPAPPMAGGMFRPPASSGLPGAQAGQPADAAAPASSGNYPPPTPPAAPTPPGFPQPGPPGFPQPGFPQPGFPQPGFPQPGFPPPGFPPPGAPTPGAQQPPYPPNPYGAPGSPPPGGFAGAPQGPAGFSGGAGYAAPGYVPPGYGYNPAGPGAGPGYSKKKPRSTFATIVRVVLLVVAGVVVIGAIVGVVVALTNKDGISSLAAAPATTTPVPAGPVKPATAGTLSLSVPLDCRDQTTPSSDPSYQMLFLCGAPGKGGITVLKVPQSLDSFNKTDFVNGMLKGGPTIKNVVLTKGKHDGKTVVYISGTEDTALGVGKILGMLTPAPNGTYGVLIVDFSGRSWVNPEGVLASIKNG